ncbi:MAG: hypothetical protein JXB13_12040 [Phycisphaerae bacterium]|nr:hypothetical protein [Phycisphaerae bacterium]
MAELTIDSDRIGKRRAPEVRELLVVALAHTQSLEYVRFLLREALNESPRGELARRALLWVFPAGNMILEEPSLDTPIKERILACALKYTCWSVDVSYKYAFDVTPLPSDGFFHLNWDAWYLEKDITALGEFATDLSQEEKGKLADLKRMSLKKQTESILREVALREGRRAGVEATTAPSR